MPKNALRMRFSNNHDERRAITGFGERGATVSGSIEIAGNYEEITPNSGAPLLPGQNSTTKAVRK